MSDRASVTAIFARHDPDQTVPLCAASPKSIMQLLEKLFKDSAILRKFDNRLTLSVSYISLSMWTKFRFIAPALCLDGKSSA